VLTAFSEVRIHEPEYPLTDEGKAAKMSLMEELGGVERDLEALRQEHGLDY
jgi:hypothetical protein